MQNLSNESTFNKDKVMMTSEETRAKKAIATRQRVHKLFRKQQAEATNIANKAKQIHSVIEHFPAFQQSLQSINNVSMLNAPDLLEYSILRPRQEFIEKHTYCRIDVHFCGKIFQWARALKATKNYANTN